MLLQILAAVLLLLGSGLIFHALFELDRESEPELAPRPVARPIPTDHDLPRAA